MISFEAIALVVFGLILLVISVDFSTGVMPGQISYLISVLIETLKLLQNVIISAVNTGLGAAVNTGLAIVLSNLVINSFKYRNLIKDISKIFDLVVSNQIGDLYNIRVACDSIGHRFTDQAETIIGPTCDQGHGNFKGSDTGSDSFYPQQIIEARRGLLKDVARIKDRGSTIRDDDLYKGKLDDIKLFKSDNLEILVRYFRKLTAVLEDLRNFTSFELPNTIDEFDTFNWRSSETYQNRTNFLVARINVVICLGLMTKYVFQHFDVKAQRDLDDVYSLLLTLEPEIQNDNSTYSLLKEDFEVIQQFTQEKLSPLN